jgi:hypothetical protein
MSANLKEPFDPSCCDGGAASANAKSALPCGCDEGAGWVCKQHQTDKYMDTQRNVAIDTTTDQLYGIMEGDLLANTTSPPKDGYRGISRDAYPPSIRQFETGATRDVDTNKYDYEGFLSPLVLERYGQFMHKNRLQKDGKLRDSDNWQKGIPQSAYMKSGWRHFMEWWRLHRGPDKQHGDLYGDRIEDALCALMFNVMGYLHEHLKGSKRL